MTMYELISSKRIARKAILLFVIVLTACSPTPSSVAVQSATLPIAGNFKEIVSETQEIAFPHGYQLINILDEGFLDFVPSNNDFMNLLLRRINLSTGDSIDIPFGINPQWELDICATNNEWLVWFECIPQKVNASSYDDSSSFTFSLSSATEPVALTFLEPREYAIYAKNILDGETRLIEEFRAFPLESMPFTPFQALQGDYLAYCTYEMLFDGSMGEVLKLYSFSEKESKIIYQEPDNVDRNIYSLTTRKLHNIVLDSGQLAWCRYDVFSNNSATKSPTICIFDISRDMMIEEKIEYSSQFFLAGNNLIFRYTNRGESQPSSLKVYDIATSTIVDDIPLALGDNTSLSYMQTNENFLSWVIMKDVTHSDPAIGEYRYFNPDSRMVYFYHLLKKQLYVSESDMIGGNLYNGFYAWFPPQESHSPDLNDNTPLYIASLK